MAHQIIIVDEREKLPYQFKSERHIHTVKGFLESGDYTILGQENKVIIERKTLVDLVSCIGRNRARFKRELTRMQETCATPILLCEFHVSDIYSKRTWGFRSTIHPNAIYGSLKSWQTKYNLLVLFAGDRESAERLAAYHLTQAQSDATYVRENSVGARRAVASSPPPRKLNFSSPPPLPTTREIEQGSFCLNRSVL